MASEIRANKQTNRAGLGTVTYADTGIIVSGIVTCTELSGLTALNIAGVGTASTLDINGDIDVDGHTNLDNLSVAGVSTFSGNVHLPDNVELNLGTHNDLEIFHNDDDAYIRNSKGALILRNNNQSGDIDQSQIYIQATPAENSIQCSPNGPVTLFHDNVPQLITTTAGVSLYRDLDVERHTNLDNVSIAGVTTITANNVIGLNVENSSGGGAQTTIRSKSTVANASNFVRSESSDNKYIGLLKYGTGHSAYGALAAGGGAVYANSSVPITIMSDGSYINFATGGNTEKVRITSGGSVNIGGDYTQTAKKFKVTGNSTFDGGIYFTGTLEGSGFSVTGGNVIIPAFIAHDADPNTKFGFPAADTITAETGGSERLRIDANGKIYVSTGQLHSSRVLARFGIDCQGMDIYDGVGTVANYGMAFYNDPNTNKANGIGFFNDDGQTCGGYIVHQDKGSGNLGDIVMATSATSNNPVERLRIHSTGETSLLRTNTFPNPNNTGSEMLGSKLIFGYNVMLEERYPNGAYTDRQDLVLRANRGYGLGQFDNIRFTAGGMVNIENKTITGGNNLAIQNFTVRGVWSGASSIGKSIELISGYDSAVKMAAIGYNLTDTNTGSTYGGDLTFHTQPLYSSPTSPIPERMRISSSGYITKSVVPSWNLRPSYNSTQTTANTNSHHAIGWSADSSGNGSTTSKATFLQNCTLHGSGFTYNLHNGQNVAALRVPVAGRYYVNVTYRVENNPQQGNIYVYVAGTQIARQHVEMWGHRPYMHCQWASVLNLAKNDEIIISISCPNANVSGRNDNVNWFSGYLIG